MKKTYYFLLTTLLLTLSSCQVKIDESTSVDTTSITEDSNSTSETSSTDENKGLFFEKGNILSALTNKDKMYYTTTGSIDVSKATGLDNGYSLSFANNDSLYGFQMFYKNSDNEDNKEYKVSLNIFSLQETCITINSQIISLQIGSNDIEVTYTENENYSFNLIFGNINDGTYVSSGSFSITNITYSIKEDEIIDEDDFVDVYGLKYYKVWADEFEGNSVDTTKWTFDIGGSGWGNNELQYYRKENATVSDGYLTITAKKESYGNKSYTSSRLKTQGLYSFTYGYVEARISLPFSTGIWPAFWTLGTANNWPYSGEIDILEAINTENKVYHTLHWNNGSNYSPAEYGVSYNLADRTTFHTYALQWEENYIRVYVDGAIAFSTSIDSDDKKRAFNNAHYILLNIAVGGVWPGYTIDESALPQQMKVDYVRVYQQKT